MRSRNLTPEDFLNERLAELPYDARILFWGLRGSADREGRVEDRPKRFKAQILPYDDVSIEELLKMLAQAGFITRYEVDGGCYIAIDKFLDQVAPYHREPESAIPPPPGNNGRAETVAKHGFDRSPAVTGNGQSTVKARSGFSTGGVDERASSPSKTSRPPSSSYSLLLTPSVSPNCMPPAADVAYGNSGDAAMPEERQVRYTLADSDDPMLPFDPEAVLSAFEGLTGGKRVNADAAVADQLSQTTGFSTLATVSLMRAIAGRPGQTAIQRLGYFKAALLRLSNRCTDAEIALSRSGSLTGASDSARLEMILAAVRREVSNWKNNGK